MNVRYDAEVSSPHLLGKQLVLIETEQDCLERAYGLHEQRLA